MLNKASSDPIYERLSSPPSQATWDRFCRKIQRKNDTGCWEWQGAKSHRYGLFSMDRKQKRAHVVIMSWLHGPIPDGMVVDHFSCDNRSCVNPEHLKIVSKRDNILRANSITGIQSRKTHCTRCGGPLRGSVDGVGRRCPTCRGEWKKSYFKKRPRIAGKRQPVPFTNHEMALLEDPLFTSVRQRMHAPPGDKTWIRFLRNVIVDSNSNCWLFGLSKIEGYGQFRVDGTTRRAHKVMRLWMDGAVTKGYHVHHTCYERSCVNPDHLKSVAPRTNALDSENTMAGRNARKTHCPKGHELAGDNLMINSEGKRVCRECHNERSRNYPAQKKREYALKSYHKNMQDPAFREKKRLIAAKIRQEKRNSENSQN